MIRAVFLPLLLACTSDSYLARVWLERHHLALQTFYNKYTRSYPAMFMDTGGDKHLQAEKQCALSFQGIMKTLKINGSIVTKEEHCRASQKLKQTTMAHVANILKISPDATSVKQNKTKPSAVYNSIIQYNFGKLNIVQNRKDSPKSPQKTLEKERKESTPPVLVATQTKAEQAIRSERKSRIAIKEIQLQQRDSEMENNTDLSDKCNQTSKTEISPTANSTEIIDKKQDVKDKFSEGYQLFQMEETTSSEDECPSDCEWLDYNATGDGNKVVSDAQVANTLKDLEEIFNRIVKRYNSTWLKQYQEGYLGAQGDSEDLLMLMKVLPALEELHIRKLMEKWSKFCKQIKDYARKNHIVYAATVSDMQLFLLEFESELDKKNYKIFEENEGSRPNSCLSPEGLSQNSMTKCNETPMTVFTNKILCNEKVCKLNTNTNENLNQEEKIKNRPHLSLGDLAGFSNNVHNSEPEGENRSIWDLSLKTIVSDKRRLLDNTDVINIQDDVSMNDSKETEIVTSKKKEEMEDLSLDLNLDCMPTNTNTKVQSGLFQLKKTQIKCLDTKNTQDKQLVSYENSNKISLENTQVREQLDAENKIVVREGKNITLKPPPGYEGVIPANSYFNYLASAPNYCGTKYLTLSLALATLPSCQTELLADGCLRLANVDTQLDFKLFTGFNFGDVELGLNNAGVPLAVRRFQKVETQCNKLISAALFKSVTGLLHHSHPHILPYLACYDLSYAVVFATPLCYHDLGQYIRQLRSSLAKNINYFTKLTPHLVNLAKQIMLGLHFLHTRDIVHGNLKPSNVMVDNSGTLRLAEFGLHEIVFQQRSPAVTSVIWWSRECLQLYFNTCKFVCTQKSDMQTAGMLVHFILTLGHHPFGQSLPDISENIKRGVVQSRCIDALAIDLIYWQLSKEPRHRPTTHEALRHVVFWSSDKKWRFLLACCGLGPQPSQPLDFGLLYRDLDLVGELRDVNTKWITIMKENCKADIGTNGFEDKPSGLLKFLHRNFISWVEFKDIVLELFPVLPLNLFRLLEQTDWIHHPQFEPFIRVLT